MSSYVKSGGIEINITHSQGHSSAVSLQLIDGLEINITYSQGHGSAVSLQLIDRAIQKEQDNL